MAQDSMRVERVTSPIRTQVLENLRQAIRDMRFKPGQRLIERELVELTGVSRTSVREALRELAAEGLVKTSTGKGMVVAGLSRDEARQVYELRSDLEALAGRLFVDRATDLEVQRLRKAFQAFERACDTGKASAMLAAKDRFYEVLFKGTHNDALRQVVATLQARVTFLRSLSLSQDGRAAESCKEVAAIVEAIEERDASRAAKACSYHVERAGSTSLQAMPED
jgi:DNA-binding GntR family transcriptional regulator